MLEELEHARARGAPILAEYVGGAFTCDAHHMTEPEPQGRGVIMCIERSLQNVGGGAQRHVRACVTLCSTLWHAAPLEQAPALIVVACQRGCTVAGMYCGSDAVSQAHVPPRCRRRGSRRSG